MSSDQGVGSDYLFNQPTSTTQRNASVRSIRVGTITAYDQDVAEESCRIGELPPRKVPSPFPRPGTVTAYEFPTQLPSTSTTITETEAAIDKGSSRDSQSHLYKSPSILSFQEVKIEEPTHQPAKDDEAKATETARVNLVQDLSTKHAFDEDSEDLEWADLSEETQKTEIRFDLLDFVRQHLLRGMKSFRYKINQLEPLIDMAIESFQKQETLVETNGPIYVCGDIHGHYSDLISIFHICGPPQKVRYLFLGDYVDRGRHSLEVICLLLACKILWPKHFILLRGNHELNHINEIYGFLIELNTRFGEVTARHLWLRFNDAFAYMPLAATIGGQILCMHGGISPLLCSLDDIRRIKRPIPEVMEPGLIQDLLWSDPDPDPNFQDFRKNVLRNCSWTFGAKALEVKLKLLKIQMIIRAHQAARYGCELFGGTKLKPKLITVFSALRYDENVNNWGAIANVSADLIVKFIFIKPVDFEQREQRRKEKKARGIETDEPDTEERTC